MRWQVWGLVVCAVGIMGIAPVVRAQSATSAAAVSTRQSLNVTLSPVTVSLETTPGVTTASPLRIRNNGTEDERLRVVFGTFAADSTGQRPRLLDPDPLDPTLGWLQVDTPRFSLAPGEWKTLTLTFAPPSDAALSYFYTVLIERDEQTPRPGETVVRGVPAVLVLATVTSPHAQREMRVLSFSARPLLSALPQEFRFRVENSGNVHLVPTGNIFIDGEGKKDLVVLSANAGGNAALPGTTREYVVTWSEEQQEDTSVPFFGWRVGGNQRWRLGRYTAHLLLVYDNGERDVPTEAFVSFWIVPWQRLLVQVLMPIVPAAAVFFLMWWRGERRGRQHETP